MTVKVKMNDAGMRAIYAGVAKKIERADRQFRARHEGKPASEIAPHVARAFSAVGLNVTSGQVKDYAAAVSERKPFEWVLQ